MPPAPSPADAGPSRRSILVPLFIVVAIDAIGAGLILPLLPFYSQRFGASPLTIGMLVASFALCQFLGAPWLGKLSDRFGRKPVLIASQLGTLLSFILLASANSLALVFLARIVDGLTAGNLSVAAAYAVDHSTPKTRKQALGVISAAVGVGIMAGPALSAALAHVSIAAPIWAAAALSALSVAATTLVLPAGRPAAPVVAAPTSAAARPAALNLRQLVTLPNTLGVLSMLTAFYFAFAMFTSQFALFLHARFTLNGHPFGPREVGLVFTGAGAINILVQFLAMKRVARHVSEARLAIISFGLLALGYAGLAVATGLGALGVALVLASLGSSLTRPTLSTALTLTAPAHQLGAVMGLNTSIMALANIVGPLLAGLLIDHALYKGWALSIAAVALGGAIVTWLLVGKGRWPAIGDPDAPVPLAA